MSDDQRSLKLLCKTQSEKILDSSQHHLKTNVRGLSNTPVSNIYFLNFS